MCRKSFLALLVASFTLLYACAAFGAFDPTRDPALVGWWSFDEGAGTVAADGSPNSNHGTINGGATWVPGVHGSALQFNGTNAYVGTGKSLLNGLTAFTLAGWISAGSTGVYSSVFGQNDLVELGFTTESGGQFGTWMAGNNWAFIGANWGFTYPSWHHVVLAGDRTKVSLYIDGQELASDKNGMASGTSSFFFSIAGNVFNASGDWFRGEIDDVWLFSRALTEAEIRTLMKGPGGPGRATAPIPADEATDVPRDVTLGWTAGEYAASHDVYFGDSLDDVNDAGRTAPLGVLASEGQAQTTYSPAEPLDYGQTYYWRVDEVNAAPDNTVYKGKIWSFTVEPFGYPVTPTAAKASSFQAGAGPQNTINGSGLTAADTHSTDVASMWMTNGPQPHWIQYEFDKVYRLHELWVWNSNQPIEGIVGFGARNVTIEYSTDGATWTTLDAVPEFAQATGSASYTANTVVDLGGAAAKFVKLTVTQAWGSLTPQTGLSEVRFFYVPVQAREPQPADSATNVDVETVLNWRPGREATSHEVYFGTDQAALPLADTVSEHSYAPASMDFGTNYFWKVTEFGGSGPYEGDVWSFTTQEYAAIDDMESYNDDDRRIYDAWVDGVTTKASGSQVGYDMAPFAERTTVRGGKQSMPLAYNNAASPYLSEAERTFDPAQNWAVHGADTLSLYFQGRTPAFAETADRILMNAIGADIWETSDQFRFAYKTLTGNGTMIARVESIVNSHAWAKGGVMIRQSTEPGSNHAFMAITPGGAGAGNGASFQRRLVAGGASSNDDSATLVTPPYWVKVERSGNSFTGSISPDGKTWTQLGAAQTITMNGPVLIGLALCSHNANLATGAEFSNVSFSGNVAGAWQVAEIGVAQPAGNSMEGLYVTVQDTAGKSKTVAHPDAMATARGRWNQWKIPLSEFTSSGVKTTAVKSMTVGVGSKMATTPGSTGTIFIDDIGFGRSKP
jgi:hypothetical protein